jgi:heterodisulfide reductase subunit A-like polyferredoxin
VVAVSFFHRVIHRQHLTYPKFDIGRGELSMGKALVIVGGGAGGGSVAAEARRSDPGLSITMIEKGPHVATAA